MLDFSDAFDLVARCTESGGPGFYRRLYSLRDADARLVVHDADAWEALPFVGKDELLARTLSERVFIPLSKIDHLRASSGTSGKGALFSPRTYLRHMEYRLEYHDFKSPILAYPVPAMPHWHETFQAAHGTLVASIALDPKEPAATAVLARAAGVDAISCFAFHIPLIAPHLVREGIAEQIRCIEICGEACTKALHDFIRETFPNATLIPFYGSSEVEDSPIGFPCRAITGEEPLSLYHGKPSHYLELIDPETLRTIEPRAGTEGELVITAYPGEPSSFPLIRFRTGDMIRVIDAHCAKHGTWSFTVLGRSAMDFVKVQGGVIRADEISRVLRTMSSEVTDRFELHCAESDTASGPHFAPTLYVELQSTTDLRALADRISRALRVAPDMTYAEGVAQGRYARLICEPFSPPTGAKLKRISRG